MLTDHLVRGHQRVSPNDQDGFGNDIELGEDVFDSTAAANFHLPSRVSQNNFHQRAGNPGAAFTSRI